MNDWRKEKGTEGQEEREKGAHEALGGRSGTVGSSYLAHSCADVRTQDQKEHKLSRTHSQTQDTAWGSLEGLWVQVRAGDWPLPTGSGLGLAGSAPRGLSPPGGTDKESQSHKWLEKPVSGDSAQVFSACCSPLQAPRMGPCLWAPRGLC